ncbi:DUF6909 family protein [Thermoflexibacter ruber]|uniref:Uncharacterized protein n=1 Tax=Thermoflexibacter ruber TaxID=1003 RepID=A0A1I2JX88_9BACT|nr:hypothetical protein [Thermoflexibacter ruber]SFF58799.1 hypothetical protein SAMN04488541_10704 [Thermoflexibacter ruber]
METKFLELTRAQESRAAIEKLYIEMRHLFNRGFYKPSGVSGREVSKALLTLRPEIYGSINDPAKVELNGLVYVIDRLPKGIEECRFIKLVSEEGYYSSEFDTIIPPKRKRNCYRIDKEQMFMEITRGRSEIYDILTHLTFLFIEADKIKRRAIDDKGRVTREWLKLGEIVEGGLELEEAEREVAFTYLSTILGRTFEETKYAYARLQENSHSNNGLFHIVYWLGKIAIEEEKQEKDREISFTSALRERIGHHIYGERWAENIKRLLAEKDLLHRPLHIISANLHSFLNSLFAYAALKEAFAGKKLEEIAAELSKPQNKAFMEEIEEYAHFHGMYVLHDHTGTNITVQIFDTSKIDLKKLHPDIEYDEQYINREKPVIFVMDYAFGEQAYEVMDELLKPYFLEGKNHHLNVVSISVMGKAGILEGGKGDLMIPTAHVFEGTADNYPFENECKKEGFEGYGIDVYEGAMITVLGTSLQNRDVLSYFKNSSWRAIGLEMEGAHYQKAIQSASKIRKNISKDVILRYAYYASDNPLITGSTLASGSLGMVGVKPTYLITTKFLNRILKPN